MEANNTETIAPEERSAESPVTFFMRSPTYSFGSNSERCSTDWMLSDILGAEMMAMGHSQIGSVDFVTGIVDGRLVTVSHGFRRSPTGYYYNTDVYCVDDPEHIARVQAKFLAREYELVE